MKLTAFEKSRIEGQCQPLIEKLKSLYVSENPDKRYNYLIDVYTRWYGDYLIFCGRYRSENLNSVVDEFEDKFVRLKITKRDNFDISYMRHTGKWVLVAADLTLNECLEMIEGVPTFHPVG
jgi:hypothetical protein